MKHGGRDADAIHRSAAAEISTLTLKAVPAAGDHVIIESLANGNAKRRSPASAFNGGLTVANMAGFIKGLVPTIDTIDEKHDVAFGPGTCVDLAGTQTLALSAILTKQIDAAWAAGDDAGGLFTGAVAANTWYHLFVIRKDSDGSIDTGFDGSPAAANIPAGYTAYRRVGAVKTDGSNDIINFRATEMVGGGVFVQYIPEHGGASNEYIFDVLSQAFSTTPVDKQLNVPEFGGSGLAPGSFAHLILFIDTTADRQVVLYTPALTTLPGAFNNQNHIMGEIGDENRRSQFVRVYANAHGKIGVVANGNGSGAYSIKTVGYEDSRSS